VAKKKEEKKANTRFPQGFTRRKDWTMGGTYQEGGEITFKGWLSGVGRSCGGRGGEKTYNPYESPNMNLAY